MKPRLELALRDLDIRGDTIKTMHRALSAADREPDVASFALHGDQPAEPVLGRLVERGLHDELKGTAYAVIDGVDGRTHHRICNAIDTTDERYRPIPARPRKPGASRQTYRVIKRSVLGPLANTRVTRRGRAFRSGSPTSCRASRSRPSSSSGPRANPRHARRCNACAR
jgi:Protein of unknown function (DUF3363)